MYTPAIKQISAVSSTLSPHTIPLPFSPVIGSLRYQPGCEGSPIPQSRAAAFFRKSKGSHVPISPIGSRRNHWYIPAPAVSKQKASVGLGIDLLKLVPVTSSVISTDSVESNNRDSGSSSLPNPFPMSPFDFGLPAKSGGSNIGCKTLVGLGFGPELSFDDKISTITRSPTVLFSPHPDMLPYRRERKRPL